MVIPSPLNSHVNIENIMMPETNETNRAGQNSPSNPPTASLVACINNAVMGIPNNNNAHLYVLIDGHTNGPLVCIHTNDCPKINKSAEKINNL